MSDFPQGIENLPATRRTRREESSNGPHHQTECNTGDDGSRVHAEPKGDFAEGGHVPHAGAKVVQRESEQEAEHPAP